MVAIMSHNNFKLEQLFKRCDTRGDGFIGQKEFRDLCRDFGIENGDADTIFYDLDHDGDGNISFDDFAFGFRDFVTPAARRGSIQLELERQSSIREGEEKETRSRGRLSSLYNSTPSQSTSELNYEGLHKCFQI